LQKAWEAVHQPYRFSVAYVVRTVFIDSSLTNDLTRVTTRQTSVSGQ
jgi:hypothetical protein